MALLRTPGPEEWILLFHLYVLLPGIFRLTLVDSRAVFPFRMAAISTTLSMFLVPGTASAVLTIPTVAGSIFSFAHGMRILGLRAFADTGARRLSHACIAAGLMYLPVGAGFLFAFRAGIQTGYSDAIVSLTSVHFHYAAFSLNILAGFVTRVLDEAQWPAVQPLVLFGIMTGPAVTGLGIAAGPPVELFASLYMTFFASALALIWLFRATGPRKVRRLIVTSAISLLIAMMLASTYAIRPDLGSFRWIHWMIRTHGILNSVGFVLPAYAAATLMGRLPPLRAVFSDAVGGLKIGKDALDDRFLAEKEGLLSLDDFESEHFSPGRVHPVIRDFYLHTSQFRMTVRAQWARGFQTGGRIFKQLSSRIGQINFPEQGVSALTYGRLFHAKPDRRGDLTAWVRTYTEANERESCLYAALYAKPDDIPVVNIAMIMPGGHMTSILCFRNDVEDGLILSSEPTLDPDAGIYYVFFGKIAVRLPLDETFLLRANGQSIHAIHSMYILGVRFLTLNFEITGPQ